MDNPKLANLSIVISTVALALTGVQAFVAWSNRDDNIKNILLQERIKFCTELEERMQIMHSAAISAVKDINSKANDNKWSVDLLNIRIRTRSIIDGKRFLFSENERRVFDNILTEYEEINFEKAALRPEASSYSGYLKRWFDTRMSASKICEDKEIMTSPRPFRE